jgi:hypothetical protein
MKIELISSATTARYALRPETVIEQRFLTDLLSVPSASLRVVGGDRLDRDLTEQGVPPHPVICLGVELLSSLSPVPFSLSLDPKKAQPLSLKERP